MRTNVARHVCFSFAPLLLAVVIAFGASASAQQNGPAIITGLSPDAVGHFDADQCRGCGVDNDSQGLCDNTCVTCHDAGRTFAGDAVGAGCAQFVDAQSCNGAWQHNQVGTPLSCFFQAPNACLPCDADSQKNGTCSNTCYGCVEAARTTFAGKSFLPDGCRQFDGNQTNCAKGWVLNGFSAVPLSCFYDGTSNECHACEVTERFADQCTNTCVSCDDPTFTQLVDEPGGESCATLAGDEGMCTTSWNFANGYLPAPCFFTAGTEKNQGGFLFIQDGFDRLGPLVANGKKLAVCLGCNGSTALEGFNFGFDESTLPGLGWTRTTITDPAAIADFLVNQMVPGIQDAGIVYIPSQEADSSHQGIIQAQVDVLNQFKTQLGAFVTSAGGGLFALNQASLQGGFGWLDAIVPGAQARPATTCLHDPTFTPPGMTTFPSVDHALLQTLDVHTYGYFLGTFDPLAILGTDQCRDITCKDPTDTNFLGSTNAFFGDLCSAETSQATCDVSWQLAGGPAFSCAFNTQNSACERCGPTFSGPEENCANECAGCDDASRTNFAGNLNEPNCEGLSGPEACASSWAIGREGLNVSCFFDAAAGFCRACETEDEINGDCSNSCEPAASTHAVILGPAFSTASPTPTPVATDLPTSTATTTPTPTDTATPSATLTAVPTPTATATAGPPSSLVPFQCYALDRDLTPPIENVHTADRLSSGTGELRRPTRLCAPADVGGADPGAPADARHLLGYELRGRVPRFTKVKHVGVTDRFGSLDVNVVQPVLVMTPTRKSREADPGAPDAIGLDPFQCYHVVGATERADNLQVTDQFGSLALDIKRPFSICLAASKNDEPVADPSAALSCYRIRQEKPRFAGVAPIFVHDQFGPRQISVKRPTELCVPAAVTLTD